VGLRLLANDRNSYVDLLGLGFVWHSRFWEGTSIRCSVLIYHVSDVKAAPAVSVQTDAHQPPVCFVGIAGRLMPVLK
jgi:hypothetical protein